MVPFLKTVFVNYNTLAKIGQGLDPQGLDQAAFRQGSRREFLKNELAVISVRRNEQIFVVTIMVET